MMRSLFALAAGLIFGLGLIAGGMTNPAKVQGFLDLFGSWDPSLALVMGGAIAVAVGGFALAARRERSWCGDRFEWPPATAIDTRLIGGGILFGIGWGLAGFCPGPAIVALGSGMPEAATFTAAMVAGMIVHDRFMARR